MLTEQKLLIVESNDIDRIVFSNILKKYKHISPIFIENLDLFAHQELILSSSLLILDLSPNNNISVELIKDLKSHRQMKLLPILVLSSTLNKAEIKRAYDLGVAAFLKKPSDLDELKELFFIIVRFWFIFNKISENGELLSQCVKY